MRLIDADAALEAVCGDCCDNDNCERGCADYMNILNIPTIDPESLRPKGEWISVEDRLPKGADGKSIAENVIAFLNNGEVAAQVCTGWINGDKWYLLTDEDDYHTIWGNGAVTHWMPLPEPPTTNEVASDVMMQARED